jgi:hypothetical protein
VVTVEFVEERGGRLLGFFEIDGSVVIGIKQSHRAAWRGESRHALPLTARADSRPDATTAEFARAPAWTPALDGMPALRMSNCQQTLEGREIPSFTAAEIASSTR